MRKFEKGQRVKTKAFGEGTVIKQLHTAVTIDFAGDIKEMNANYVFTLDFDFNKKKEVPMIAFDEKLKESEKAMFIKITHGTTYGDDVTRNIWVPKSLVKGNTLPIWFLEKTLEN